MLETYFEKATLSSNQTTDLEKATHTYYNLNEVDQTSVDICDEVNHF